MNVLTTHTNTVGHRSGHCADFHGLEIYIAIRPETKTFCADAYIAVWPTATGLAVRHLFSKWFHFPTPGYELACAAIDRVRPMPIEAILDRLVDLFGEDWPALCAAVGKVPLVIDTLPF